MNDLRPAVVHAVPARRRYGDSFHHYMLRNLVASVPALLGVLSLGLAFESLSLPPQCGTPSVVNWMICDDADAAGATLDLGLGTAHFDAPPAAFSTVSTDAAIGEAAARLDWASRLALLIVATVLTIGGALYHARNSLLQQALFLGLAALPAWPKHGGVAAKLRYVVRVRLPPTYPVIGTILVFAGFAILLLMAELALVSSLSQRSFVESWREAIRLDWLLQPDVPMKWLLGRFDAAAGRWAWRVMVLVGIAMAAISLLLVLVLMEGPDDRSLRLSPAGSPAAKMADYAESPQEMLYRRYLARSFNRLKQAVWMGGALLAALVAEFGARYAWAMSFVDPTQQDMLKALTKYSSSLTFVAGIGFSFYLFAVHAPAVLLLRERGREYFRARCPNASNTEMESYLTEQGLSISLPHSYTELIALLAPTGMAALGHVIGVFAGPGAS